MVLLSTGVSSVPSKYSTWKVSPEMFTYQSKVLCLPGRKLVVTVFGQHKSQYKNFDNLVPLGTRNISSSNELRSIPSATSCVVPHEIIVASLTPALSKSVTARQASPPFFVMDKTALS